MARSTLNIGSKGREVKALQERIIEIKQHTVLIDGKVREVKADGDFGKITAEAVEAIKAKFLDLISIDYLKEQYKYLLNKDIDENWLKINSEVTPLFWLLIERWYEALDHFRSTIKTITPDPEPILPASKKQKLINEVIAFEKGEIGVREKTGNNDGERVEWYQKIGSCGEVSKGAPYCQYGQNTSLKEGCKKVVVPYKWDCNGYTPYAVNKGKKLKITKGGNPNGGSVFISDVQIGDWGYIYSSARRNARHVFIITGKKENNVLTIEFNTDNQGGSEGNGVFNRIRPITQVWATIRWADLYE